MRCYVARDETGAKIALKELADEARMLEPNLVFDTGLKRRNRIAAEAGVEQWHPNPKDGSGTIEHSRKRLGCRSRED